MDLQISVVLLFSLFSAGHSFSCYECSGLTGCFANQTLKTCPSGSSKCMSSTTVAQVGGISDKVKYKDCAADCVSGFLNIGIAKTSLACCNTDQCNVQDAPDPSNVPNGKTCYSCDDKSCTNILSCSGGEDRCFKPTVSVGGQSVVKGCVSKSICDAATSAGDVQSVSCCEGNLCNGAESVTQSANSVNSVTQSANSANSVTQSANSVNSVTQSANSANSVTQRVNSVNSVTQRVNSAKSVTQSVLFLCGSLFSFILLH